MIMRMFGIRRRPSNTTPHRSSRLAALLIAVIATLLTAVPALAYNNENVDHLRLTRLDPLACGTPIRLQALVTSQKGTVVSGALVHFRIVKGSGATVSPHSVVSDAAGIAISTVTIRCGREKPDCRRPVQVLAWVSGEARARITLVVRGQDCTSDKGDKHDKGDKDDAAALTTATGGSGTPGTASLSYSSSGADLTANVTPASVPLLPMAASLLGLVGLGLYRGRKSGLGPWRPATS